MDPNSIPLTRDSPMAEYGSPPSSILTPQPAPVALEEPLRKQVAVEDIAVEKAIVANHEGEKIVEYGGPNNRYGKFNVILGKGAYKIVWKAIDLEEGIEVAWNSCQSTKSEYAELSQEIEILKRVRHPNIITFHDSWYSNGELVFITEMMTSGNLRDFVSKLKNPNMKIIKRWGKQLLKGLYYLHSHSPPILHRDIKCDNIFINGSHGEVKIGDMGTAKMRFGKKYTVIGTPEFMAPEMYEEKGYSEKVDIYAFGMCLLEMATGQYPYSECKNAAQIYKKVSQGLKPDCLALVEDKETLTVINACLAPEEERWSAKRLLDHPMFADDPEVVLVSADDKKTKLVLQVVFKGYEKHCIKFDFNVEQDTAEDVVREMIQEQVLSSRYQGLVSGEIHRILRDLSKLALEVRPEPRATSPPVVKDLLEDLRVEGTLSPTMDSSRKPESQRSSDGSCFDFDIPTKEYPNDYPIEDFVSEIALSTRRPIEKANEWLLKLRDQDIMTVGDLRHLHDEDWSQLNLTVFACRSIRNALQTKPRPILTAMQGQTTIKPLQATKPVPIPEDPHELLLSTSPIQESNLMGNSNLPHNPSLSLP